jgi:serine/threonine-protein kinase
MADADTSHHPSLSSSSEEARAFLQERLAYLGRTYAVIGLTFYGAGTVAAALLSDSGKPFADVKGWIVPGVCAAYLVQWLLTRGRALSPLALRAIDGATTTIAAALHSMMVFTTLPGELAGMSYSRSLLLFTFGLVLRATMVPSSARRTLVLGLVATLFTAIESHLWYLAQPPNGVSPLLHTTLTALWSLGAVVVSTLASHVIFGLRREVREARRLGQYTLIEKIGEGGMGTVYRASHSMLRRPTAVKLLPLDRAGSERVQRFEREVQLTSQLTHPNTVSIFDYGRTPDGVFYYAMEYLEGVNLEELVRATGPLPPARVIHILRQVAAALSEAHGIGLVHRDIKPSNVILVADRGGAADVAKVVDFGLVKELEENAGLTREGRLAGTPHYLAPEVIGSPRNVVPQSDLYALGCVGYYLLTGQRVFEARTVIEVCSQHLYSAPTPPAVRLGRELPADLSAVLMACLEKTPDRRPASAQALVEMLDGCQDAGAWTADDARAWWAGPGATVSVPAGV